MAGVLPGTRLYLVCVCCRWLVFVTARCGVALCCHYYHYYYLCPRHGRCTQHKQCGQTWYCTGSAPLQLAAPCHRSFSALSCDGGISQRACWAALIVFLYLPCVCVCVCAFLRVCVFWNVGICFLALCLFVCGSCPTCVYLSAMCLRKEGCLPLLAAKPAVCSGRKVEEHQDRPLLDSQLQQPTASPVCIQPPHTPFVPRVQCPGWFQFQVWFQCQSGWFQRTNNALCYVVLLLSLVQNRLMY